jgi:PEP-CTERM motif
LPVVSDSETGTETALGGQTLTGIQADYWSGTELDSSSKIAWHFNFFNGVQGDGVESRTNFAWAVRPGDVAAAPEPASLPLIGAGMLGLGWARRRERRR